jgi:hypothetical protein
MTAAKPTLANINAVNCIEKCIIFCQNLLIKDGDKRYTAAPRIINNY